MAPELRISDSQPWLKTGSAAVFLTLFILILIRLIWVQLRTFQVFPEPSMTTTATFIDSSRIDRCAQLIIKNSRTSSDVAPQNLVGALSRDAASFASVPPDWIGNRLMLKVLCSSSGVFDNNLMVRLNETFFFLTCMVIGFLCRLVTGKWFVGLIAVISLMSRGRVLGELGLIGVTYFLMLCFSAWALTVLWFHMTRSKTTLLLGCLAICIATLFDWRFAGLHVVFPVSILFANLASRRDLEKLPQGWSLPEIGSLKPLNRIQLVAIASDKKRSLTDGITYILAAILSLIVAYQVWRLACVGINGCSLGAMRAAGRLNLLQFTHWSSSWWLLFQEWDLHFIWSLIGLLGVGVAGKNAVGSRYIEGALTVLIGCIVIGCMRIWYFPLEMSLARTTEWHRLQHILIWGEPVVLAFAIVAIYRGVDLVSGWLKPKGKL